MNYDKQHNTKLYCVLQDISASNFSYNMYTLLVAYKTSKVLYFMKHANTSEKAMRQFINKVDPPI